MATHPGRVRVRPRRRDDDAPAPGRLGRILEPALALVALLALAGVTLAVRPSGPATVTVPVGEVTGGAPAGTPVELAAAAADLLEGTTGTGGTGYRFEIVQRSTLVARPDGPLLEIPDPADRTRSLGLTDRIALAGLVEIGVVTPAGFYAELRAGPMTADAPVEFAGAVLFRALVRDGVTYRDDGEGWYRTDAPPGIGLDRLAVGHPGRRVTGARSPTASGTSRRPTRTIPTATVRARPHPTVGSRRTGTTARTGS